MLQLRYNGCPDCLTAAKIQLANIGLFSNRDYTIEFHKEHREDKVYKVRPDFLKNFSGAVLYNPDVESWIDLYNQSSNIIDMTEENKAAIFKLKNMKKPHGVD